VKKEDAKEPKEERKLPRPIIKKMRWPFPLVWLVPVLAAILAGFYYREHLKSQGPEIVLKFKDADGLKPGQTEVLHRGVPVGKVSSVHLSDDKAWAVVKVRLDRDESSIAQAQSRFWIVRPEISGLSISGLGTVVSGPYIEASPGNGPAATEFVGLQKAPLTDKPGLVILLQVDQLDHLSPGSPVYYRGIQVGMIQSTQLASDSSHIDIHLLVWPQYAPLVHTDSQFWRLNGFDFKGGLFSGISAKLDSVSALISGAVAFATPDDGKSGPVLPYAVFPLNPESKKEWLQWTPKIPIEPNDNPDGPDSQPNQDMKLGEKMLSAPADKK
jgi:paraquat-inducible protein B